jgi:chorismate dehydratase
MSSQSVPLNIIDDTFAKPLVYALEKNAVAHPFELRYASLAENAQKLSTGETSVALVSPIDYARNATDWEVLYGLGIASYGVTGAAKLLFRKELEAIHTIAADLRFPTEMVAAQIIFLEKTGIKPRFLTREVQPGVIPESADAVLLIGNDALPVKTIQESVFDLSEEWNDLAGLPLVHAVFAARRNSLSPTAAAVLMQSHSYFIEHAGTVIGDVAASRGIAVERLHAHFNEEIRYALDETDTDGMKELFRHCFYHGMLDEIPEIVFAQSASADQTKFN